MSIDTGKHIADEQGCLLTALQGLLEEQIKLAHQGDINTVEILNKQAGLLVEKIVQTNVFESAEFKNQRKKLQKLYEELSLAVAAQKAETSEQQLSRIRKGRKTLHVYRGGI
jgi:hypothetical protein